MKQGLWLKAYGLWGERRKGQTGRKGQFGEGLWLKAYGLWARKSGVQFFLWRDLLPYLDLGSKIKILPIIIKM